MSNVKFKSLNSALHGLELFGNVCFLLPEAFHGEQKEELKCLRAVFLEEQKAWVLSLNHYKLHQNFMEIYGGFSACEHCFANHKLARIPAEGSGR